MKCNDPEYLEYFFEERAGIYEEIYPKDMSNILAKRDVEELIRTEQEKEKEG